jgi:choline dehydrogenase
MTAHYDYIVVGGGSAGCIVAGMLSRDRTHRVALVELGDRAEAHPETLRADGYKDAFNNDALVLERFSTPQTSSANRRYFVGTGKGMGGSGSINGMVYTRGARQDYAEWPQGFQYDDCVPAFEAVEKKLRVRPRPATRFTETFVAAAIEAGFRRSEDINDGDLSGVIGYETMNYEGDTRRSSYVGFIAEGGSRENLELITHARALRVTFENKRAVGIEIEQQEQRRVLRARVEVILCLGALETPKLLMLSGVGPAAQLVQHGIAVVHDAPEVGRNLHDHPNVPLFFRGAEPVDASYPQLYGFQRANPDSDLPPGQSDTCYVMYPARSSLREAAMRMLPTKLPSALYGDLSKALIRRGVAFATRFGSTQRFIERTWAIVVILGKPKSRGTLALGSADPHAPAAIDPNYLSHPEDLDTLVHGVALARRIAGAAPLSAFGNEALLPSAALVQDAEVRTFVRDNAISTFHFVGTCRLGTDAASVVDPSFRVRGVEGLRIADASIVPSAPVSALNAPSMMIGYRAAELLSQERRAAAEHESAACPL